MPVSNDHIKVVNKHKISKEAQRHAIYIGRGTPFGNPFTVEEHGRAKAVALYASHFNNSMAQEGNPLKKAVDNLIENIRHSHREVHLMCFCKPQLCHGDVIKSYIDGKLFTTRGK